MEHKLMEAPKEAPKLIRLLFTYVKIFPSGCCLNTLVDAVLAKSAAATATAAGGGRVVESSNRSLRAAPGDGRNY